MSVDFICKVNEESFMICLNSELKVKLIVFSIKNNEII